MLSIDPRIQRALRKVGLVIVLDDLRSFPGNHLVVLKGDRAGQRSIGIDDQWRICLRWTGAGAEDVEITDYH